jgi:hypothetical protein
VLEHITGSPMGPPGRDLVSQAGQMEPAEFGDVADPSATA